MTPANVQKACSDSHLTTDPNHKLKDKERCPLSGSAVKQWSWPLYLLEHLHGNPARASSIEEASDQQDQEDSVSPEIKGFILALRLT